MNAYEQCNDRIHIYTLTESPEPPISLQEAAAIGDVRLVRTLIDSGADVDNVENSYLRNALHYAARNGHKDVAELLIAEGAYINARAAGSTTPLHEAAGRGHMEVVRLLIDNGADVNAKESGGETPLDLAVSGNHREVVGLFIAKGADATLNAAVIMGDLAKAL